ncbi:MAG: hypothetical protein A2004_05430 [Spirochaetes bacterium GWC1_61_12]|nr:MAG: hypothetical protein A2004_05430 [Spirochaetes bacterium GWC1_61_12]HAW86308.1 hypothetical protein [Spirochaetaceae bacterium]
MPDIAVYNQARQLYAAYLASYQAQIEPALVTASTAAVSDQVRIDTLRRYGELVTQYPALVDYLAIEAGLPPRDGSQP